MFITEYGWHDKFESSDYILFYGKSPREWSYDPSSHTYSHYLNHYTESNFYFMTYGGQAGKRMTASTYHASSYYMPYNFHGVQSPKTMRLTI